MNKAVLIYSGGLDSTTLLYQLVKEKGYSRHNLIALSFDYGQRHSRELLYAGMNTSDLDIPHHVINFRGLLAEALTTSSIVKGGPPVPDLKDVKDLHHPPTYVPFRNLIMLSIAAAFSESQGCTGVYYAAHKGDHYGYWDCTPGFISSL